MRASVRTLLVLVCLVSAPAVAWAQTVAGAVRDTSGALLPGVTVEATSPALIEKVRTAIREEIEKLLGDGVTEKELAAAKDGFLQKQEVNRSDDSQLAATLADTLEAGRTMAYYSRLEESVRDLTTEDVLHAMRKHLKPEKLYTVVSGDFAKDKDEDSE